MLISLLTFYLEAITVLFRLTGHGQSLLLFWGFFTAGVIGCTSIMVIINGMLQAPVAHANPPLRAALVIFWLLLALFCYLLYHSINENSPPPLRPGETITI